MNEENLTGYPSIDKPWLKYYSEEAIKTPLPKMTMYQYIWEKNQNNLDTTAIEYFGRRITYKSLFENIGKAAKAFATAGIKSGDIVTIASVTLPETIYAVYGLNRIGAIPNMVDPRTSTEGIRDYINEVSASMVLTIDLAYAKIVRSSEQTTVKQIVTLSAYDSMPTLLRAGLRIKEVSKKKDAKSHIKTVIWDEFINAGKQAVLTPVQYQAKQCAIIVHTGGTTGMPKGVMISNDNANAGAHEAMLSPLAMKQGDTFLNIMPPFIAYGVILGIHTPLSWSWKSVIIPKFDPASFGKLLLKHKPNGIIGVPSYYECLMSSKKLQNADLSFLHCVLAGGDKTASEFEIRINEFLHDHHANIHLTKGYSMTEASAMATVSYEDPIKIGSNGVPLVNTVISAFQEGTEHELQYEELGEICISSPTIMMGYYQNQKATDDMIWTHQDGSKWIHTGDLGYVDKDGLIYIEGRLKRMIIRFDGFKIFPPFIEKVIQANSKIDACCAVGKADKTHGHGQIPVVFYTLKAGLNNRDNKLVDELRRACEKELPEYSQPREFRFLTELPHTPIGKIDYRALEKMAAEMN